MILVMSENIKNNITEGITHSVATVSNEVSTTDLMRDYSN